MRIGPFAARLWIGSARKHRQTAVNAAVPNIVISPGIRTMGLNRNSPKTLVNTGVGG